MGPTRKELMYDACYIAKDRAVYGFKVHYAVYRINILTKAPTITQSAVEIEANRPMSPD